MYSVCKMRINDVLFYFKMSDQRLINNKTHSGLLIDTQYNQI